MRKQLDILTKSGFLLPASSLESIELTSLGKILKKTIGVLKTKENTVILENSVVSSIKCPKSLYLERFFQFQREQKIGWMKYSSNPARYHFSDFVQKEDFNRKVDICSSFSFGSIEMETIQVLPVNEKEVEIKSIVPLDKAALGILLDATEGSAREILNLHRKIAPIQVSLFYSSNEDVTLKDHISKVLKRSGIRVDLEDSLYKNNADFESKDKIGVPLNVIVDQESLRMGLLKLRNRDTMLSEIIHLSCLPDYLVKILNS